MEQLAHPWGGGYEQEQEQQQQQEPQLIMEQQLQVAQEECNELIKTLLEMRQELDTLRNRLVPTPCPTPIRKTLKLKFLFFFIYFCPVEPKCDSKHSQTDHGNYNSHACNFSIVYAPVHVCSVVLKI